MLQLTDLPAQWHHFERRERGWFRAKSYEAEQSIRDSLRINRPQSWIAPSNEVGACEIYTNHKG